MSRKQVLSCLLFFFMSLFLCPFSVSSLSLPLLLLLFSFHPLLLLFFLSPYLLLFPLSLSPLFLRGGLPQGSLESFLVSLERFVKYLYCQGSLRSSICQLTTTLSTLPSYWRPQASGERQDRVIALAVTRNECQVGPGCSRLCRNYYRFQSIAPQASAQIII